MKSLVDKLERNKDKHWELNYDDNIEKKNKKLSFKMVWREYSDIGDSSSC